MRWVLISWIILFTSFGLFGQTSLIDSLKSELQKKHDDTGQVKLLNKLSWQLKFQQTDTSILLAKKAHSLIPKAI